MKDYCFVAQPFDKSVYDRRYDDIIEPTVESCGLKCYRVDRDDSVEIPVNSMEEKIAKAALVIAEITEDNPNVWYELGYAFALEKPVIMVCSKNRQTPYPFDIQHKTILEYSTESASDFQQYQSKLRSAIKSRYRSAEQDVRQQELTEEELLILKFISRDQKNVSMITPEEKILKSRLNPETAQDCLKYLSSSGYLEYIFSTDGGKSYYHLTDKAEKLLYRR